MQRWKTLVLSFLGLCLVGGGAIWIGSGSFVRAKGKVPAVVKSTIAERRLGIEVGLAKEFMVPAAKAGHTLETYLRVQNATAGSISAVKLAPKMVGDKIEVTVSVISGDTSVIKSCNDWGKLKESRIASYTLSEGEQATVSQLSNLGPNFKGGTVSFKAVSFTASPEDSGCGCGRCVNLECCPNKGECIGCGTCGDVCCRITGFGELEP
jgi:hypothetical protein